MLWTVTGTDMKVWRKISLDNAAVVFLLVHNNNAEGIQKMIKVLPIVETKHSESSETSAEVNQSESVSLSAAGYHSV